jgi:hypothetical protein
MAERKSEEERLAMEKALRERRWRAAGHIQRFWQGYKVRKVNKNKNIFLEYLLFICSGSQSEKEKESEERQKRWQKINELTFILFSICEK